MRTRQLFGQHTDPQTDNTGFIVSAISRRRPNLATCIDVDKTLMQALVNAILDYHGYGNSILCGLPVPCLQNSEDTK